MTLTTPRPEAFNYLPAEWRAYIADLERALAQREWVASAWLIEFGEPPAIPTYFCAGGGTTDAWRACWFSRKVDAEAVAFTYLSQPYRIISHGFVHDAEPPAPTQRDKP